MSAGELLEAVDTRPRRQAWGTAVDDALKSRRINEVNKAIRQAALPIPGATFAELDYLDGRGITPAASAAGCLLVPAGRLGHELPPITPRPEELRLAGLGNFELLVLASHA